MLRKKTFFLSPRGLLLLFIPHNGTKICSGNILTFNLTLSEPAFFGVSHEPGGPIRPPSPWYLSPEAFEELVLNITIVTIFLMIILRYVTFL